MQNEDKASSGTSMRIREGEKIKWTSVKVKDNEEVQTDEEGYCHGLWISKYPNGKPKLQETYVHGIQHGPFTTWHENGQKASEGAYQKGELHGPHTLWYKNGQKREESQYVEGKLNGPQTLWFENGQKHLESHYVDGECKGLRTLWYENGQKAFEALSIKEGVIHGNVNFWHENGHKSLEGRYIYGTPHGPWTEWDDQGRVLCRRRYVAGVQYGRGLRFFTTPLLESMSRRNHLGRQLIWLIVLVVILLVSLRNDPQMGLFVLFLVGLWIAILVHELGHFAMAKLVGIPIQKFVIGFGPKLATVLWGHTIFELRVIPIMGYVQPYSFRPSEFDFYNRAKELLRQGEPLADEPVIDGEEDAKAGTEYVTRPRRLAFLLGGITFNLLAAFLIAWLALIVAKNPDEGNLPVHRNPLAAAKLVVHQSMQMIGSIVPSLRPSSRPDSQSPASVVGHSLGIGGYSIFFVSVLLALLNLLPISPLDGFGALRTGIEMALRRPLPKKILYPIMISGGLLIGLVFVADLAFVGAVTIGSIFNLEALADKFHKPATIVGPLTGTFIVGRNLELSDGNSRTPIEPETGNQFIGLRFCLEGVKMLVPAEYPIEDTQGNRYSPLGVAFGSRGPMFYSSSFARRTELRLAPEGSTSFGASMSFGRQPKLYTEELSGPDIILLYEVPEDAAQFNLRHHELDYSFTPETIAPAP